MPECDQVSSFSEGLAAIYKKKKRGEVNQVGAVNKKGEIVIPYQFINEIVFSDGLAFAMTPNYEKVGYIDKTGKLVLLFDFKTKTFKKVGGDSTLTHE